MSQAGLRTLAIGSVLAAGLSGGIAAAPGANADGPLVITSGSCNSSTYSIYCQVRFTGGYAPITGTITSATNATPTIRMSSTPGLAVITGNCFPALNYRIAYTLTDSIGQTASGVVANRCTI